LSSGCDGEIKKMPVDFIAGIGIIALHREVVGRWRNALEVRIERDAHQGILGSWILAVKDFRRARSLASREKIVALLGGRPAELICYEDVPKGLRDVHITSRGLRDIPIDAIVGSVGRCTDFTRSFMPLRDDSEARWARVGQAWQDLAGLPPIEVYQIGDVYFVVDGNHRVSVARQLGKSHIEAHVAEFETKVPLSPGDSPDDLIVKAEYAEFLAHTRLDELRPGVDLTMSVPGHYRELEEQIAACCTPAEAEEGLESSYEGAVARWYDEVYLPVIHVIRKRDMLHDFSGRTETDLYVWILKHRAELGQELDQEIGPEATLTDLADRLTLKRRRPFSRAVDAVMAVLKRKRHGRTVELWPVHRG
jgi:hypothetical protein